jgi:hypothetical protein
MSRASAPLSRGSLTKHASCFDLSVLRPQILTSVPVSVDSTIFVIPSRSVFSIEASNSSGSSLAHASVAELLAQHHMVLQTFSHSYFTQTLDPNLVLTRVDN